MPIPYNIFTIFFRYNLFETLNLIKIVAFIIYFGKILCIKVVKKRCRSQGLSAAKNLTRNWDCAVANYFFFCVFIIKIRREPMDFIDIKVLWDTLLVTIRSYNVGCRNLVLGTWLWHPRFFFKKNLPLIALQI